MLEVGWIRELLKATVRLGEITSCAGLITDEQPKQKSAKSEAA